MASVVDRDSEQPRPSVGNAVVITLSILEGCRESFGAGIVRLRVAEAPSQKAPDRPIVALEERPKRLCILRRRCKELGVRWIIHCGGILDHLYLLTPAVEKVHERGARLDLVCPPAVQETSHF